MFSYWLVYGCIIFWVHVRHRTNSQAITSTAEASVSSPLEEPRDKGSRKDHEKITVIDDIAPGSIEGKARPQLLDLRPDHIDLGGFAITDSGLARLVPALPEERLSDSLPLRTSKSAKDVESFSHVEIGGPTQNKTDTSKLSASKETPLKETTSKETSKETTSKETALKAGEAKDIEVTSKTSTTELKEADESSRKHIDPALPKHPGAGGGGGEGGGYSNGIAGGGGGGGGGGLFDHPNKTKTESEAPNNDPPESSAPLHDDPAASPKKEAKPAKTKTTEEGPDAPPQKEGNPAAAKTTEKPKQDSPQKPQIKQPRVVYLAPQNALTLQNPLLRPNVLLRPNTLPQFIEIPIRDLRQPLIHIPAPPPPTTIRIPIKSFLSAAGGGGGGGGILPVGSSLSEGGFPAGFGGGVGGGISETSEGINLPLAALSNLLKPPSPPPVYHLVLPHTGQTIPLSSVLNNGVTPSTSPISPPLNVAFNVPLSVDPPPAQRHEAPVINLSAAPPPPPPSLPPPLPPRPPPAPPFPVVLPINVSVSTDGSPQPLPPPTPPPPLIPTSATTYSPYHSLFETTTPKPVDGFEYGGGEPTGKPSETNETKMTWGYRDTATSYGPQNWPKIAPKCNGVNQSPINIITNKAIEKSLESEIAIAMDDPTGEGLIKGRLINNGKTVGFDVGANSPPVRLVGELTEGSKFILRQFHLHFGCDKEKGSEHTIDGERYSGEIHMVFKNEKYANAQVAMQQKDGLTIIAFFLEVKQDAETNSAFERLEKHYPSIQFAKQQVQIPNGLSIISLIPPLQDGLVNLKRYVYKGSLPTPPCYESVTWVVFSKTIQLLPNMLPRKVFGDECDLICNNARPLNELNERKVFKYTVMGEEVDRPPAKTTPTQPSNILKTTRGPSPSKRQTRKPDTTESTTSLFLVKPPSAIAEEEEAKEEAEQQQPVDISPPKGKPKAAVPVDAPPVRKLLAMKKKVKVIYSSID